MTAHLEEKLSAYLDGELEGAELESAELHLEACAECRAELEGLRRVVRRAATLDDQPPAKDLWAGISQRIATPSTSDVVPLQSRRRKFSFTMPQLAAAAALLMAVSAGVATVALRQPTQTVTMRLDGPGRSQDVGYAPGDFAVASYDSAITGMQAMLVSRRGSLDTSTVRVLEQSISLIDFAIKQAREALSRDPGNKYLNGQLQRTLGRKLEVLRNAVTLPVAS